MFYTNLSQKLFIQIYNDQTMNNNRFVNNILLTGLSFDNSITINIASCKHAFAAQRPLVLKLWNQAKKQCVVVIYILGWLHGSCLPSSKKLHACPRTLRNYQLALRTIGLRKNNEPLEYRFERTIIVKRGLISFNFNPPLFVNMRVQTSGTEF